MNAALAVEVYDGALPPWLAPDAPTALCAEIDAQVWFPEKGQGRASRQAKRLCRACPLLRLCREWALAHPQQAPYGIWGGLSENDRTRRHRGHDTSAGGELREVA